MAAPGFSIPQGSALPGCVDGLLQRVVIFCRVFVVYLPYTTPLYSFSNRSFSSGDILATLASAPGGGRVAPYLLRYAQSV